MSAVHMDILYHMFIYIYTVEKESEWVTVCICVFSLSKIPVIILSGSQATPSLLVTVQFFILALQVAHLEGSGVFYLFVIASRR